jgi:threonine synthase
MAKISHFECSRCGERLSADRWRDVCPKDAGALYVRYDLMAIGKTFRREDLQRRDVPLSMWRYSAVLPEAAAVTLGEGFTPLLPSRTYQNVWIKDEGVNPTGSFKARGMSVAVTMAKHWGVKDVAAPSAGNAGGALAAYAAVAGIAAHVFMPKDVPLANVVESRTFGADVNLVDGLISDCGRIAAERAKAEGWTDMSTLKEPFRVEGKKTMGYEIAEQMGWRLPDAIFYPTGGGVGLIGMWKAFVEMEKLGWLQPGVRRPKMIAVQSLGCAPIVKAEAEGKAATEMWHNAETISAGLRVPKPYGDYIILDILKQSGGRAVAVSDVETLDAVREWARTEGLLAAPEGAACLAAYKRLLAEGFLRSNESIVLFNTGSGFKYIDVFAAAMKIAPAVKLPAGRNIGGIIGPY